MPMPPEAVTALKENLRQRCEAMRHLLELEQRWPVSGEPEEKIGKIQQLLRAEKEGLQALSVIAKSFRLPAPNWEACLALIPQAERADVERDLKVLNDLTVSAQATHQKNTEQLSQQFNELGRALQGIQQARDFVQALRQTRNQAERVNLVG